MINVYVVVGATGTLGSYVAESLCEDGKTVIKVSASFLTSLNSGEFSVAINELVKKISDVQSIHQSIGIILAHRYRGDDILTALKNEVIITHDLVWYLSKQISELRVVVLGSITGGLVDHKSAEAYHFSKDLQKVFS